MENLANSPEFVNSETSPTYNPAVFEAADYSGLNAAIDRFQANRESRAQAERAAQPVVRLVQVPSAALGKVLDSHDAAHAIKLLAIKASHGPGYVLNERNCRKAYGMSRWAFQAGMRLAKGRRALIREQNGQGFAKEQPLDVGNGRYVLIDEKLLTKRSALIGFIAAVNLSPEPIRPRDAAARLRISSKTTVRKLVTEALKAGAIAKGEGDRGAVLLGRKGQSFDPVKNQPAKFQPAKNHPTHRGMEEPHSEKEVSPPCTERARAHITPSRARAAFQNDFQDEVHTDLSSDPDWIALKPWQNSPGILGRSLYATKPVDVSKCMSIGSWQNWLDHFSSDVPGHLKRPAAHRQAMEIAHELASHPYGHEFSEWDAMAALAVWVARACEEGRNVRSFGFIAERLFHQLDNNDTSSIHDRPAWGDEDEIDAAGQLAHEMFGVMQATPEMAPSARLISTAQIETLAAMIRKHGRNAIVDGFNRASKAKRSPGEGKTWWAWGWLDDDIAAVSKRRARKAA